RRRRATRGTRGVQRPRSSHLIRSKSRAFPQTCASRETTAREIAIVSVDRGENHCGNKIRHRLDTRRASASLSARQEFKSCPREGLRGAIIHHLAVAAGTDHPPYFAHIRG